MKASLSTPPSISVRPAHASIRIGHLWDLSSFDKQNIAVIIVPLSPAMDPSDDVEPSPPKKHRPNYSDAKKAAFTNNFKNRHKKKGRGLKKDTSISKRQDGLNSKRSSYNFAGVGEHLGTGPDSQSIKSKLMPDKVLLPEKRTPKEYEAQITQLSKRIEKNEQKHQRHRNMSVAKLKMKDEAVKKLNQTLARQKEQYTAKLEMKD